MRGEQLAVSCGKLTELIMTVNEVKTHKDLQVWQKAMDLVEEVYETTKDFPLQSNLG